MIINKITDFLFRPTDIASLVFFRVIFGMIAFADVVAGFVYLHLIKDVFNPDKFQFRYYGFEWVRPLSEPWMSLFFILLLLASIGITLGKWYRVSSTFFAFGFVYVFLLEKAYYLNHGYLICLLSFIIILMPLNRAFSLDALKKPIIKADQVPYWSLFLLQFMMGLVYFYGGIAKLNMDWLNGIPLLFWLQNKANTPIIGSFVAHDWVAYFMSYGGLLLDLFVTFFLIQRRTRIWALGFVLFFHLTNFILFQIGVFPFLSITLTLLFFPSDFPRKGIDYLVNKFSFLQQWRMQATVFIEKKYPNYIQAPTVDTLQHFNHQKKWIPAFLILFISLQLLIPLRHHYFKGSVAWTEEGHRYSWRMMLRSKSGYGHFEVIDGQTLEKIRIAPIDFLNKRQKRKLYTHPDMILQFAHFLRDKYQAEGMKDVKVFAHIKTKLNGRKYQPYIDSERDLAQEKWLFFEESDWIVPLKEK